MKKIYTREEFAKSSGKLYVVRGEKTITEEKPSKHKRRRKKRETEA